MAALKLLKTLIRKENLPVFDFVPTTLPMTITKLLPTVVCGSHELKFGEIFNHSQNLSNPLVPLFILTMSKVRKSTWV
jgi:hypothetical protein